jgi:hypothetical protein
MLDVLQVLASGFNYGKEFFLGHHILSVCVSMRRVDVTPKKLSTPLEFSAVVDSSMKKSR